MAEQKLQRMEILDAEHCAWLMVLAKTRPEFDHNLFFRRYPEMISKIFEIREIVGFRLVEWENSNPRDPVRIMKNQLAKGEKLQCQMSMTMMCNQTVTKPQNMIHPKNH